MRITLTVQRAGAGPTDLEVTADATATVADLAEALLRADPLHPPDPPPEQATLQVGDAPEAGGRGTRTLARDQDLIQAGLRSGSTVRLVPAPAPGDPLDDAERDGAVALLRVLSGPEAGREIPLGSGSHVIGREGELDVRLADPLLSRRHARLNLGEVVEIIDLDSTHGLHHGDQRVPRVVLGPADTVRIGGSTLAVIPLQRAGGLDPTAPALEINRSPRVVPRFPPRSLRAPTPPREPAPTVFPIFMLFAPLLMGAFLFGLTRSPFALVFVVMMPMMAVAGYLNRRYQQRRTLEQQIETFERALAALTRRLAAAQEIERAVRDVEAPSTAQAVDAALRMGPLLWTHRPEHPAFATLRLGLGIAPSRVGIEAPSEMGTLPEYQDLLDQVQEDYRDVAGVPVVADLREAGNLGLAGSGEDADGAARGLVLQLCALHSPAELVLAALVPPRGLRRWDWLPWLPHTASPHSPLPGEHLADSAAAGGALLGRLEDLLAERGAGPAHPRPPIPETRPGEGEEPPAPVLPTVVVLVEDDAPVDRARLVRLAERGPDVGVHLIWHAPTPADLPAACRTTLDLSAPRPVPENPAPETPGADAPGEGTTVAGHVRRGERFAPVSVETLDAAAAATTARRLAPMVDAGVPLGDDSDLPRSIALLALTGPAPAAEPRAVARAWTGTGTDAAPGDAAPGDTVPAEPARDGLGALVGHDGQHPFRLDLRRQGPHALVGGTTGSGKSEFLQSWVLGMAAAHSPARVSFLFVDYKGGAAFADCVRLPHAVGLVTDLSPHLVRRALTSLRAVLRQREHLLQRKGAKDLLTLERRGDPDCPPSLVVVVDEFAALATEIPEFVDGMVDIAARGRSLGLHLILATQRPAGVIKDSLRANTNLRIALRTADAEDSTDILGDRMAAHIDPDLPGRAVAASGPGRLVPFQAAYAGGRTGADGQRPDLDIVERPFSRGRAWEQPAPRPAPTDRPTSPASSPPSPPRPATPSCPRRADPGCPSSPPATTWPACPAPAATRSCCSACRTSRGSRSSPPSPTAPTATAPWRSSAPEAPASPPPCAPSRSPPPPRSAAARSTSTASTTAPAGCACSRSCRTSARSSTPTTRSGPCGCCAPSAASSRSAPGLRPAARRLPGPLPGAGRGARHPPHPAAGGRLRRPPRGHGHPGARPLDDRAGADRRRRTPGRGAPGAQRGPRRRGAHGDGLDHPAPPGAALGRGGRVRRPRGAAGRAGARLAAGPRTARGIRGAGRRPRRRR